MGSKERRKEIVREGGGHLASLNQKAFRAGYERGKGDFKIYDGAIASADKEGRNRKADEEFRKSLFKFVLDRMTTQVINGSLPEQLDRESVERFLHFQLDRAVNKAFSGEATPEDLAFIDKFSLEQARELTIGRRIPVTITIVDFISPNDKTLPKAS